MQVFRLVPKGINVARVCPTTCAAPSQRGPLARICHQACAWGTHDMFQSLFLLRGSAEEITACARSVAIFDGGPSKAPPSPCACTSACGPPANFLSPVSTERLGMPRPFPPYLKRAHLSGLRSACPDGGPPFAWCPQAWNPQGPGVSNPGARPSTLSQPGGIQDSR